MQNVVGPTLIATATNFGQFLHKIASKSASVSDRPQMFGPTRGFLGIADLMETCKKVVEVGATLAAMATKSGLGAEI